MLARTLAGRALAGRVLAGRVLAGRALAGRALAARTRTYSCSCCWRPCLLVLVLPLIVLTCPCRADFSL